MGWLYGRTLWPHPWTWTCSFNVKVWNSLIWGMWGLIDMERKGYELIIHDHECSDLWVTMVGWVDVLDSYRGDFRRRRAVDISSWWCLCGVSPNCLPMMTSSDGIIFRVTGHLYGEFTGPRWIPTQRPVKRSFDVYFDLRPNKRLSKQPWGWLFETPSRPLWRHRNALITWTPDISP